MGPTVMHAPPCHVRRELKPSAAKLPNLTRQQLEQIVNGYLVRENFSCSPEFRRGIVDFLRARAFREKVGCPFVSGTAQADAYHAGIEQSYVVWQELTRKGGC
jgi:hypothetical protein